MLFSKKTNNHYSWSQYLWGFLHWQTRTVN
jgi:hypothetical protein